MEEKEKKPITTAPNEEAGNIQADVDAIMKKYDRESNVRI